MKVVLSVLCVELFVDTCLFFSLENNLKRMLTSLLLGSNPSVFDT
jgi:hypothetical protein